MKPLHQKPPQAVRPAGWQEADCGTLRNARLQNRIAPPTVSKWPRAPAKPPVPDPGPFPLNCGASAAPPGTAVCEDSALESPHKRPRWIEIDAPPTRRRQIRRLIEAFPFAPSRPRMEV